MAKSKPDGRRKNPGPGNITHNWKRQWMFLVWSENQNRNHVARVCDVAPQTVDRYKRIDKWEERLALALQYLETNPDDSNLERARSDAIQALRVLKAKAQHAALTTGFKDAKDAFNSFERVLRLELELRGHMTAKDAGLLAILAERYQLATAKGAEKSKDVTNKAQVETVGENDNSTLPDEA